MTTAFLLKFRQKAINEMVTGIDMTYAYKNRNYKDKEGKIQSEIFTICKLFL